MPPGMVAPYRVGLDGGQFVWPSSDCDSLIRTPRGRWASWLWGSTPPVDMDGHEHALLHPHEGHVGGDRVPPAGTQESAIRLPRFLTAVLAPLNSYGVGSQIRNSRRAYAQGRYADALFGADYARQLAYRRLGEGSYAHETALFHLASTYAAMNRDDEALDTLNEAVALAERLHGADSLILVPLCNARAEVHESAGQYADAVAALDRARELRRAALGAQSIDFGFSCFHQAQMLARQAYDAEAESTPAQRGVLLLRAAELGVEASAAAAADADEENGVRFLQEILQSIKGEGIKGGGEENGCGLQGMQAESAGPVRLLQDRLNLLPGTTQGAGEAGPQMQRG